jgi:hypothetical protein
VIPESISPGYVHRDKFIQPKQGLSLKGRLLKWYEIGAADRPVPAEIHNLARVFLDRRAGEGSLDQLSDLGFVVLHRCGEHFYFLIACSWRGNNEIWETVFAKDIEDIDFKYFSRPESHLPTFCVWELGAICHEQRAWRRFLLSERDETAVETWLVDQYEGPV